MDHSESEAHALTTAERVLAGLAKVSMVMRQESWRSSGDRGLTPTQAQVLAVLSGSREAMGIKAVAQHLAVTMATASEAVSTLVEKGLVEKTRDERDGRAIVLALTDSGEREARLTGQWPDAMRSAVDGLPTGEQAALLRGLIGMIRTLEEQGAIPTTRMCVGCRFFRPNEYAGRAKPHHCALIDSPIGNEDLRLECPEMEPVGAGGRKRLWQVFLEGRPLGDGPLMD